MKKLISFYFLFHVFLVSAQTDFSEAWEDLYSYNNVKSIEKVNDIIYALSDNAVFTYNLTTEELTKISSIQGLSGETTSAFHYSEVYNRLIIGYENGLIEILDENGSVSVSSEIVDFTQAGSKTINHIAQFGNMLYLATPFAIVEYDIEKLEFGDTFYIGNNSSEVTINEIVVYNNQIYAAAEDGLYIADITSNLLIDFTNWNRQLVGNNITAIEVFDNQLYIAIGRNLSRFTNFGIESIQNFDQDIQGISSTQEFLSVALNSIAIILNTSLSEVFQFLTTEGFPFTLNNLLFEDNTVFLATNEYGILNTTSNQPSNYIEIHPEGPLSNEIFSITATDNNLWVVYGGYDASYVPLSKSEGFSSFNGENWTNIEFTSSIPFLDFVDVTVDPTNNNRIFISSFAQTGNGNIFSGGGLLEIVDNELSFFYNSENSPLSKVTSNSNPLYRTTRVSGTVFDSQGNLWIADALAANNLKKLDANGNWTSINLSSLETNTARETNMLVLDNNNSVWMGTRRNGVYVYNENGDKKRALKATANIGNLPDLNVIALAVDGSNRIWIGTRAGLVVYNNAANIFDENLLNAEPVVILDDGVAERLLGEQIINTIAIDGADNKWFGVDNGGVLYTNPSGQTTLATFTLENSPLPSNRILKIAVNNSTGKVFFATDRGIVAYNSNVAPFGERLGEVYAYPNPVLKQHATVTIDGRNGENLPKGTNVKIVDVAGNLVYETNVVEGQELQGGKVVWNKKNLAGRSVSSGVYIVLLTNEDASQNTITKIAIVN